MHPPLRRVLLAVTGSSGARDVDGVVRGFQENDIGVTAVLTSRAESFAPALEVETFTDAQWTIDPWHILLPERVDAFVVVPATCNTIAKASHGFADNLVLACMSSWPGEVLFFPGMNRRMWNYSATVENVKTLRGMGHYVATPLKSVAESSGAEGDAVGWSPEYVVGTTLRRAYQKKISPEEFSGHR